MEAYLSLISPHPYRERSKEDQTDEDHARTTTPEEKTPVKKKVRLGGGRVGGIGRDGAGRMWCQEEDGVGGGGELRRGLERPWPLFGSEMVVRASFMVFYSAVNQKGGTGANFANSWGH